MSNIPVSKIKLPNDNNNYFIKDNSAKTAVYTVTLNSNNWTYNSTTTYYTQTINLYSSQEIDLHCGSDGNSPPIVTSESVEWGKIKDILFDASLDTITVQATSQPTSDVIIKILDFLA